MDISLGVDSSPPTSPSKVPSPAVEVTVSTQRFTEPAIGLTTTVNSTGSSQLPILTYGDVRSQLPPATTFESLLAAGESIQSSTEVGKLMLDFTQEASKLAVMTPNNPVSLVPSSSGPTSVSIPTSYTLGERVIGNLGAPSLQPHEMSQPMEKGPKDHQSPSSLTPRRGRSRLALSKNQEL